MKKVAIWFLTAQKFIFGFVILFASIPVTYAVSDKIFDYSFLIILTGLVLYALTAIPLTYAVVIGYDGLIHRLNKKRVDLKSQKVHESTQADISYTLKEEKQNDEDHKAFTLIEKEKT